MATITQRAKEDIEKGEYLTPVIIFLLEPGSTLRVNRKYGIG